MKSNWQARTVVVVMVGMVWVWGGVMAYKSGGQVVPARGPAVVAPPVAVPVQPPAQAGAPPAAPVEAQVPTLPESSQLKLQTFELRSENLRLQSEMLQQEARTFYESLTLKDHALVRDPKTGRWVYTKNEKK